MLPEVQIKKILDFLIDKVDENYLYKVMGETSLSDYSFFENASKIFLKKQESDRHIQTHIFFNYDRAALPTIHINLPSENMSGDNGLDWDNELGVCKCDNGTAYKITPKSYAAKYNIICTSSNTFEVLIMYYVIKSLIQGNIGVMELNGLRNIRIGGSDIIFNEDFMPQGIYSRGLMIDFIYTFEGISYEIIEATKSVIFNGQTE